MVVGRRNITDPIAPLLVFVVDAPAGLEYAVVESLDSAVLTALVRLSRQHSVKYVLGGAAVAVVAGIVAQLPGRVEEYEEGSDPTRRGAASTEVLELTLEYEAWEDPCPLMKEPALESQPFAWA